MLVQVWWYASAEKQAWYIPVKEAMEKKKERLLFQDQIIFTAFVANHPWTVRGYTVVKEMLFIHIHQVRKNAPMVFTLSFSVKNDPYAEFLKSLSQDIFRISFCSCDWLFCCKSKLIFVCVCVLSKIIATLEHTFILSRWTLVSECHCVLWSALWVIS